jgi:hypothetical protein
MRNVDELRCLTNLLHILMSPLLSRMGDVYSKLLVRLLEAAKSSILANGVVQQPFVVVFEGDGMW